MTVEDVPNWAVLDLREILDTGQARCDELLTADERGVIDAIRALPADAALAYARLSGRRASVFAVDGLVLTGVADPTAALAHLQGAGLLSADVSCDECAEHATVDMLKTACRALSLPLGGRRDDLIARLRGRSWATGPWVRVVHRALLDRLTRFTTLRLWADRSGAVLERMGLIAWPSYTPTPGGFFVDRAALLAWESAVSAALAGVDADAALGWLDHRAGWPVGGLSPAGWFVDTVLVEAQAREQAGDPAGARTLYEGLIHRGRDVAALAFRIARTHEAEGDPRSALAVLRAARPAADPVERLQIARSERRLGKATGLGFAPDVPLRTAHERELRLVPAGSDGARPLWRTASSAPPHPDAVPVEAAVIALLGDLGRTAVHGEGTLWTTLFALLFADAYFLPVPGMLPARRLSGPLDVGRPGFAARRADAVTVLRAAIRAGEAPERIRQTHDERAGQALAGAAWGIAPADVLATIAHDVGPVVLDAILGRLLDEGWAAAAGLPDLVVLAGPEVRVPGHPSRVQPGALFVEVKGPTDAVRDAQAVWFHRLVACGARVERWNVRAL